MATNPPVDYKLELKFSTHAMFPVRSHQANGSTFFVSGICHKMLCASCTHSLNAWQNRSFVKALNPEPFFDHTRERGTRTKPNAKPVQTNLPYLFSPSAHGSGGVRIRHSRDQSIFGLFRDFRLLCVSASLSTLISRPTRPCIMQMRVQQYAGVLALTECGSILFSISGRRQVFKITTHTAAAAADAVAYITRVHPARRRRHRDGSFHLSRPSRFMMRALLILDDSWA